MICYTDGEHSGYIAIINDTLAVSTSALLLLNHILDKQYKNIGMHHQVALIQTIDWHDWIDIIFCLFESIFVM